MGVWSWPALWLVLNVALSLVNRRIFRACRTPALVSALHMLVSWLTVSAAGGGRRPPSGSPSLVRAVFPALFALNILVGNAALGLAPLHVTQTVRAAIPASTALLSRLTGAPPLSRNAFLALLPVVAGVAIVASAGAQGGSVSGAGLAVVLAGVVLSSTKTLAAKAALAREPAADVLRRVAPAAGGVLLGVALVRGEPAAAAECAARGDWAALVALSGGIAAALNVANLRAQHALSPVAMNVLGNVKAVATVALAHGLLGERAVARWRVVAGVGLSMGGSVAFALAQRAATGRHPTMRLQRGRDAEKL